MTPTRQAWWIRHEDGSRLRLSAGGTLLGREADCDIVLPDPGASRRQALLYVGADGPVVVALGRAPTQHRGQPVDGAAEVQAGDTIDVPGLKLAVESEIEPLCQADRSWVLERVGGGLFGVGPQGFVVGGAATDDLQIDGCPTGAIIFRIAQNALVIEPTVAIRLNGGEMPAGEVRSLHSGDKVGLGDHEIRVVVGGDGGADTTAGYGHLVAAERSLPSWVRLQFLPRGGRLYVDIDGKQTTTYLADRRCDLIACLLQPPSPYEPGDLVPDDVIMSRVWPGKPVARTNLGVLLHRLRKDLIRADLDGTTLITRAEGGGATRFALRTDATVTVE